MWSSGGVKSSAHKFPRPVCAEVRILLLTCASSLDLWTPCHTAAEAFHINTNLSLFQLNVQHPPPPRALFWSERKRQKTSAYPVILATVGVSSENQSDSPICYIWVGFIIEPLAFELSLCENRRSL